MRSCVARMALSPRSMFRARHRPVPRHLSPAINGPGAVTGEYVDASDVNHGFVRALACTLTTFDVPAAATGPFEGTIPLSNNSAGAITGYYIDASDVTHGFLRNPVGRSSVDAEVASQPLHRILDLEVRWQIFMARRRESGDAKV